MHQRELEGDFSELAPLWINDVDLPRLEHLDEEMAAAFKELERAEEKVREAKEDRDHVAKLHNLLWCTGKFQLKPVRDAFSILRFVVKEESNRDAVLYEGEKKVAIVEIEGSNGAVNVVNYRQLLDYVQDELLLDSGTQVKGIIAGNGFRHLEPENRNDQFTDECRRGALSQNYCLLPTSEPFNAVKAVIADPSEGLKETIRKNIIKAVGDLLRYQQPRPPQRAPHQAIDLRRIQNRSNNRAT